MSAPKQRPGMSKQDYATPDDFITAVKKRLGIAGFAVDLAADASNAKAVTYLTKEQNSLAVDWSPYLASGWGWLNPEFRDITPWAAKCARTVAKDSRARIALLTPASIGANWYRDYIDRAFAQVLALNGRLSFIPDHPNELYPKDCILTLFGQGFERERRCEVWTWKTERRPRERRRAAKTAAAREGAVLVPVDPEGGGVRGIEPGLAPDSGD